jgi:hypothetical protein
MLLAIFPAERRSPMPLPLFRLYQIPRTIHKTLNYSIKNKSLLKGTCGDAKNKPSLGNDLSNKLTKLRKRAIGTGTCNKDAK